MTTEIDTFTVASDRMLHCPLYRAWLKRELRKLKITQRGAPTAVQDALGQAYRKEITLQYTPVRFEIPLVDQVWGDERYLGVFMESQDCRHPEKDRLFDLLVRLEKAGIYRP